MKASKFPKRIIALLCGAALCFGGLITAFAEGENPLPGEQEQVVTDVPIVTDPPIVTEPIQTFPIETEPIVTEPVIVTDPPTAPPTQEATTLPQAETQPVTQNGGGYIEQDPQPTEFVPPTIPKTVSEKSYTTNYAFGIISWICVLVGVIVIISVAISTKASGYSSRRGI